MKQPDRITAAEYRTLVGTEAPKKKIYAKRKSAPRRSVAKERSDTFAQRLLRLMARKPLSSRIRLKPEEMLAIAFADALRALALEGRLRCVWTHPANEIAGQRSSTAQIRYAIAKAMGLIDGTADYLFLWSDGSGALEAKIGTNGQQPNQVDFEAWCEANGVKYATFTTVEEGIEKLRSWGAII